MRVLAEPGSNCTGSQLLLVDLDFFKKVNDLYGHIVGDEVLKRGAATIRDLATKRSLCARLGGDEFAVVIPRQSDQSLARVVERILEGIAQPIVLGTATAKVYASIGISRIESEMNAVECLC